MRGIEVALVRPRHRDYFSTMRFSTALEQGLAGSEVSLRHEYPPDSVLAQRLRLGRADSYLKRRLLHSRSLRHARADVFHIIDHSYAATVKALPADRTVVTCHDLILLAARPSDMPAWERRSVERFRSRVSSMAVAAAVACDSAATKRDVIRFTDVSPERIRIIPGGVAAMFRPMSRDIRTRARQRLQGKERFLLLHVNSGGFYKNVQATLDTVAVLRAAGTDVALVRVGVPLSRDMRQRADAMGIGSQIRELGRPSDEELVTIYGAVDALIFPSLIEGFGLPVLEAMACGTPVVASDIGALGELLGGAGLTAPPEDAGRLAAAVHEVLTDQTLAQRLRDAGLARARAFSWRRVVDEYRDLYHNVAEGTSSLRPREEAEGSISLQ